MIEFLRGFQYGLGLFCAFGVCLIAFFIIMAGLVGIGNIAKRGIRPPMSPTP